MKKNSFVLYSDYLIYFNRLELLEKGKLIDALLKYADEKPIDEEIKQMKPETEMAFLFISHQMDLDIEKWERRCEINSQNGARGGAPKGNQNAKKLSEGDEENNQKQPKTTENKPNDNENDIDNDIKKKNKKKTEPTKQHKENTVLKDSDIDSLIEKNFNDLEVATKFREFIDMRKAKGQSKAVRTLSTFDGLVKKLRILAKTKDEALEIIQNAIDGCWQSFFPLGNKIERIEDGVPYAN